jgi:hypothetical protein
MSRIIRRLSRPENVTQALPDVQAICMDSRSDKNALVAYVGITCTNLGISYMKYIEDQHMLEKAKKQFPDIPLDMDGKLPSMVHTLWLDNGYRQCPGAIVDAQVCPPHDFLMDEAVEAISEDHMRFKVTLYRLGLETRKDATNVDVVDIPMDEVELMMGMSGSLTIDIEGGRMTYECLGDFSESTVEEAVKRIAAINLPGPDMLFGDDDSTDS